MKFRRCLWALLAVSLVLLAVCQASAFGPRRPPAVVQSPYYGYPGVYVAPSYGYPYNTPYGYPYVMPYIAPYPAYGILPPPFAVMQRYYADDLYLGRRATGLYSPADALDYE